MLFRSDIYRYATAKEIVSLGTNTESGDLRETIADHTTKIIEENESQLIKKSNNVDVYNITF